MKKHRTMLLACAIGWFWTRQNMVEVVMFWTAIALFPFAAYIEFREGKWR